MAKVMADTGDDLRLGHFVNRFHRNDMGAGFGLLESLFQFTFGLARTQNQDRSGIAKKGNDLVVVACQAPVVLSLARIVRGNRLEFKSAGGWLAGAPGLRFRV